MAILADLAPIDGAGTLTPPVPHVDPTPDAYRTTPAPDTRGTRRDAGRDALLTAYARRQGHHIEMVRWLLGYLESLATRRTPEDALQTVLGMGDAAATIRRIEEQRAADKAAARSVAAMAAAAGVIPGEAGQ